MGPFNDTPEQLEILLERGRQAKRLLTDDGFNSVVDDLTQYNLAALVAAPPGDRGRDAREHHHLLQYALTQICAELKSRVDTADQVEERMAEDYLD